MKSIALFFCLLCAPLLLKADAPLRDVQIKGIVRIDKGFVLSHLPFKKRQMISKQSLQAAMNELFATGLFADVKAVFDKGRLVITVTENSVLNQIAFEGNKKVDDELLHKELKLKPRQIYTPHRVQKAVQHIKSIYRVKGYVGAQVTPKIIRRPQGRVDLVFEIQEGQPQRIKKIVFQGNHRFSDSQLRTVILTRESRWYRFFSNVDSYEPDRLAYDRELLYRHYMNNGYPDIEVLSVITELSPDQTQFYLTFQLQEGKLYHFGKIKMESKAKHVNLKELNDILSFKEGDIFSQEEIEYTTNALTKELNKQGLFCHVRPDVQKDAEKRTMGVTFVITDQKPFTVRSVLIKGNTLTNDEVIRRECQLSEGDPITSYQVDRTRQKLMNLDFFKKVDVHTDDVLEQDNQKDLIVEVEDKSTGELMFSGGYSTADGILFEAKASERNFMGRGQETEIRGTIARRRKSLVLGFTEPYVAGRRLEVGGSLFASDVKQDTQGTFKGGYHERSYGGRLRTGFDLNPYLFERIRYSLHRESFKKSESKSVFYAKMADATVSQIGHDLIYDKRDSAIDPTKNGYISFSTDYAGIGGTVRHFTNQLTAGYYFALDRDRDFVVRIRASYGLVLPAGKPLRVMDQFFMGGSNIRGFEESGVGPRDQTTGDAIGGQQMLASNLELSFPLGPYDFGLKGFIFNDWGSLWDSSHGNGPNANIIQSNAFSLRSTVGVGLRWRSPIGLIGFSLGKAVRKVNGADRTQVFRLNYGTDF
ncbi:MAG: outer membrane protein assembly factor BamA [Holosporaceae bacterium]